MERQMRSTCGDELPGKRARVRDGGFSERGFGGEEAHPRRLLAASSLVAESCPVEGDRQVGDGPVVDDTGMRLLVVPPWTS
jgi:hypothetical protein